MERGDIRHDGRDGNRHARSLSILQGVHDLKVQSALRLDRQTIINRHNAGNTPGGLFNDFALTPIIDFPLEANA